MKQKVAVIGAGLVGRAWSIVFARAGHEVALYDPADGAVESALALIEASLPDLEGNDLLRGTTAGELRARLSQADDLAAALADVAHVQENAPERVEVKRDLWADLDRLAPPEAVLASSTSAIPASAFTEPLAGRNRCLVAHPINPPHLVPLVELVPAPWTDAEVVTRTRDLMKSVGQAPITLKREIAGFIANRLQVALMEEGYRLVEDDVCDVADVDIAIRDGIGMRWAFIGPYEVGDLNAPGGIRDYCQRFANMFHEISKTQTDVRTRTPEFLDKVEAQRRQVLAADRLVERGQWRDRRLMEMAVWKNRKVRD